MDRDEKQTAELLKMIEELGKHHANLEIKAIGKVDITPNQCRFECRKLGLVYHSGMEDRVVHFRFTDTTVDRDGDVIISKGVNLAEFKKDPIILAQHAGRKFPIGKAYGVKFQPEEKDVVGNIIFFDDEIDNTGIANTVFGFVNSGGMNGGSIGFDCSYQDVRKPSPEEKTEYKMPDFGLIFDKIKLIEFSIVTVPANLNARQIPMGKAWTDATNAMKEAGSISEEYLAQLRKSNGDEPAPKGPDPEKETHVPANGNMVVYIGANDSPEMRDNKLTMAETAKSKGFAVEIIAFEEKKSVTNVVNMTDEQKGSILDTLEALDTLKEKFQNLLSAGNENESNSPDSPEGEVKAEATGLYSMLDELETK